jgi:hypothetical protein
MESQREVKVLQNQLEDLKFENDTFRMQIADSNQEEERLKVISK